MKKIIVLLLFAFSGNAQSTSDVKITDIIEGTLFTPNSVEKPSLVILIAGSGATNRSGNQVGIHNNSLKYLAEGLVKEGIAVFSFDKRVVAMMKAGINPEKELRFSHQIDDVRDVIKHFKNQNLHGKIIVAGHSEGSLIGMVASRDNADAFISLAGAGRKIDKIITEQITRQMPSTESELLQAFESLAEGNEVTVENQVLASFFRPDLQPFLKSWVDLDPQQEIRKLNIPVLIINGTKDYQVPTSEAELLKAAKPEAKLHLITNMNHLFKEIKGDDAENLQSYNNPNLPVMPELIQVMTNFIKKL